MIEKNIYPIDIFSVFEYGIEKWQKWFFWPFHPNWFIELLSEVKDIFSKFINQNDNEIGDIALINIVLYCESANILYAIKVMQELRKKDMKINYSDKSLYFKGVVEKGIPETSYIESAESRKQNPIDQLLLIMARIRDTLLYRFYFLISKDKIPLVVIKKSVSKREYFSHLSRRAVRLLNNGQVFKGRRVPISKELLTTIKLTADQFISDISAIADKYSIFLNPAQREFIKNLIFKQFKQTAEDYASIKDILNRNKTFHLFTGSHGSRFVRMLGLAVRRRGGKVTSFDHGYTLFECLREIYSTAEWNTVDEFVVQHEGCIERIKKIITKYPCLRNNKVSFVSENSKFFIELYNKKKNIKLPGKIKEVMVIGFPYRIDFVRPGQLPDIVYLDYEIRLIDFLVKHGYKVLYKKHPDGSLKGNIVQIFSERSTIIYEHFEEIMDMGDAYIFSTMGTTTWGQAMCTNKPIIYINNNWHDIWFPEVYESVKKRCRIVSGGFDERNRFMFNEKELLDALVKKPEIPNTEFIQTYYFPK